MDDYCICGCDYDHHGERGKGCQWHDCPEFLPNVTNKD